MKNCLLLILLMPAFSFAQECKLEKSTDPFNHETKLSTGFTSFNKGSLKASITVDATPSLIDIFVWITSDPKCYDNNSTVDVVFEGEKSKMKFKNTGSMNCDGAFHFSFKNSATTNAQLNRIATKKISTITLTGNDKSQTVIALTEEQKTALMNMVTCAINEGKKLLK